MTTNSYTHHVDHDEFGFKGDDGGPISRRDYLDYLRSHPEPREVLQIRLELSHIELGKADDPCLCPLARAIKASTKCDYCEVWLDSIIIDGEQYDTTDQMKEFIDFFDQYGCIRTVEAFLGKKVSEVFTLDVKAGKHLS